MNLGTISIFFTHDKIRVSESERNDVKVEWERVQGRIPGAIFRKSFFPLYFMPTENSVKSSHAH